MCERDVCVCDKVVCERLCVKEMYVTKLCVKELCVKGICDKVVWKSFVCHQSWSSAISATPATQSEARCHQVPCLPHQQRQSQSSAIRAALPRKVEGDVAKCHACKVKLDVTKSHACHANSRGDHDAHWDPSAPPEPIQRHKCHACHAK